MPTYCFEILKLSIETDTIDKAECEKLINENQDVVTEKYNGKTLLNHTCLRLN